MLGFAADENFNMHIVNGVLRRLPVAADSVTIGRTPGVRTDRGLRLYKLHRMKCQLRNPLKLMYKRQAGSETLRPARS